MAKGGRVFPKYWSGMTGKDRSAREHQTMSNAARDAIDSAGPGLLVRDKTISVRNIPKPLPLRMIKVVAVVVEPPPESHTMLVREVMFKTEGADYVPPDSMPDPPPPVEPVPPTLRWAGDRIRALPGYNHSVAEFASAWFSDILRDDAGEPELVGNETVMRPPDDTTTLHYLHLRPQGPPVLFPMEGGGGFDFAVVRSVEPTDPEISVHQSYTVWAQGIQRISGWPPDSMPDPMPEHGGWEWVGDTQEVATYPGIAAIYYKPFVWDGPDIFFPDIPIARVFRVGGETYIEQPMRWATIEVDDGVRVSACLPVTRRTEDMP